MGGAESGVLLGKGVSCQAALGRSLASCSYIFAQLFPLQEQLEASCALPKRQRWRLSFRLPMPRLHSSTSCSLIFPASCLFHTVIEIQQLSSFPTPRFFFHFLYYAGVCSALRRLPDSPGILRSPVPVPILEGWGGGLDASPAPRLAGWLGGATVTQLNWE